MIQKVSTAEEIERIQKSNQCIMRNVEDFGINETFPILEKGSREAWDIQVNSVLDSLKYTVDLEMQEKDG
ncbi:hypothetical protein YTPLAS73_05650 [Nitrosarchaeum sp.]|nr:hypothetical protein YTPLAS73_05650 [Nitrosarchaeum sp.]